MESYKEGNKLLEIIRVKFLSLQVCTNFEETRIEKIVNELYPCGTSNGWVLSKREETAPISCDTKKGFTHYILDC